MFSKELEKQIEYWECKYKTDTKEIDEQLENLKITLEEKSKEIESLKKIVRTFLFYIWLYFFFVGNIDAVTVVVLAYPWLDFNRTFFNAIYTYFYTILM